MTDAEAALVDQFVVIEDGRFVLEEKNILSEEVVTLAKQEIAEANARIEQLAEEEAVFVNARDKAILS